MKNKLTTILAMGLLGHYFGQEIILAAPKQVLNLSLTKKPRTTDPAKSTDTSSGKLIALVTEGLVDVIGSENGKDKIIPAGATSWKISEDGMTYTFYLNPNAKWSDGKSVTAKDYKYGMMRNLNPETASLVGNNMYMIKGAEEYNLGKGSAEEVGINIINDLTLEFTLSYPASTFLETCKGSSTYPQRQDMIEKYGERYGSEAQFTASNGPYVLTEWVHGGKTTFEKNPYYWDSENVKIEKINMPLIPDENARMNMLYSGQLDLDVVSKNDWIKKLKASKEFAHLQKTEFRTRYELINTKSKYFQNAKIRKAYALAFDRDEFNKIVFEGLHTPAYGWISNGVVVGDKNYRENVEGPIKNLVEKYKDPVTLLKEGLKELGLPEDPNEVYITYLCPGTDATTKKAFEYTQQIVKKNLGINLIAEFVEWPVYLKRTEDLEYEVGAEGWTIGINDPYEFLKSWTTKVDMVPNGWSNAEYDELVENAKKTKDPIARLEMFKKAEKILIEDEGVIVPLVYFTKNEFVKKSVKGYNPPSMGATSYKFKGITIE